MNALKGILSWSLASRKLVVLIIVAVATVLNAKFGKPLDDGTMYALLAAVAAWLIGQGVSDAGAQGSAREAAKAVKQGGAAGAAILRVLERRTKPGPAEKTEKAPKPEPVKAPEAPKVEPTP